MASGTERLGEGAHGAVRIRGALLRLSLVLPGVVMAASLVGLALHTHSLLADAAAGRPANAGGFGGWLAVGAFFGACVAAVVVQCVRMAARVAGPEHRLVRALRRIREDDVGFRVSLRRGDLLTGLARETNELLDWLNQHPPAGSRTGGDVVEVAAIEPERSAP
jgi:hypothetical protein